MNNHSLPQRPTSQRALVEASLLLSPKTCDRQFEAGRRRRGERVPGAHLAVAVANVAIGHVPGRQS